MPAFYHNYTTTTPQLHHNCTTFGFFWIKKIELFAEESSILHF